VTLRVELDLFAGVRPCKLYDGARTPLVNVKPGDIDLVILREQTEGLFASQSCGVLLGDQVATETMVMTRRGIERICEFAFLLAEQRPRAEESPVRKVTCVDKANVFKSFAFFRKIFTEVGNRHSLVEKQPRLYRHANAAPRSETANLRCDRDRKHVRRHPVRVWRRDSSAAWAWPPRRTLAPITRIFQPRARHRARHRGERHRQSDCRDSVGGNDARLARPTPYHNVNLVLGAERIEQAVSHVLADGKLLPVDQGGSATTVALGKAIADWRQEIEVAAARGFAKRRACETASVHTDCAEFTTY